MQRTNVRVIQAGNRLGFSFKPLLSHWIMRELLWQNLDGHGALEPRVLRAIHLPHPARAQRGDNLVWAKPCAWTERHKCPDYKPAKLSPGVQPSIGAKR